MANFTTPGVYIQEISTLPPSVAPVPTSIPVFIGYTEKADITNAAPVFPTAPIRITSILDYQTIFGGANVEPLHVTLTGSSVNVTITDLVITGNDFCLFYNLLAYFANGGGPCYIISVGGYSLPMDAAAMLAAVAQAEKVDEITMVVAPDALSTIITNAERRAIYDAMLAHCAKMQDRFSILDVKEDPQDTIANDAISFRNDNVGANNLSYGAAYYPSYVPALNFLYDDTLVTITATNASLPANVQAYNNKTLSKLNSGVQQVTVVDFSSYNFSLGILTDEISMGGITTSIDQGNFSTLLSILQANTSIGAIAIITVVNTDEITITANTAGVDLAVGIVDGQAVIPPPTVSPAAMPPDTLLYNRIKTALNDFPIVLYPSSMMAGVYCNVDGNRGVWKAPANVGVTLVDHLNRNIKDADQSGLNVDASSGKSINAIRTFTGRGDIVWGARTLDGNSNEWRYINVRRTFLFAEDSCKKASAFVVFEPNDANTWQSVKGTISNFLTTLWRDGALAGSKPEQAFFVRVGLNETMSAQDILEGRLIVQIGLAVVRPAEFIVLQFEHKLQES